MVRDTHRDLVACFEASRARVSQFGLKTGGDATWMVHVALSWRWRGDEFEDGLVDTTAASDFSTLTLPFSLY
jgi:hypothetical protein